MEYVLKNSVRVTPSDKIRFKCTGCGECCRNDWNYYVKEGDYTPQYVYREKQIVSAIMSISGMSLFGNTVRYHIHQR